MSHCTDLPLSNLKVKTIVIPPSSLSYWASALYEFLNHKIEHPRLRNTFYLFLATNYYITIIKLYDKGGFCGSVDTRGYNSVVHMRDQRNAKKGLGFFKTKRDSRES